MKLELLKQADWVLNTCGRPVPPKGYKFVDLYRVIPFHFDTVANISPATPFNQTITNNAATVFLARGITINSGFLTRLRWPSGRFLSQQLLFTAAQQASPQGTGGTMLALPSEEAIDPDGRITVQISGLIPDDNVDFHIHGVLRYLLKDTDASSDAAGSTAGSSGASCLVGYPAGPSGSPSCVVGYPARAASNPASGAALGTIPDPIAAAEALPRYWCTPNRNIMAPEWALGNQCTPETPEGFEDEPFTFFSAPIAIPNNSESYNNAVIVPGGCESVVIRSLTFFVTLSGDGFSAIPVIQIRLPNGYSITGGDMIPAASDQNFIPQVFQLPVFPSLRVTTGDRIIIDAADMLVTGAPGTTTLVVQFDGVKRRRQ